ncbi:hypothetical protein THRCLA_01625 [Thraustotheca clavata]|uniref:CUE domain-containing protein n=1 Tax=Thraustotheca clavata TaxID=74557 RepID=A0A1W0A839_9STRA|nr:hypothetical protein THRCLA_01625 [Thraustotheca clavata]
MTVALKIGYKGEIHRVRVDLMVFGFVELESLFEATFGLSRNSFVIQWKGTDGNFSNVGSYEEFYEACQELLHVSEGIVRFFAVSKTETNTMNLLQAFDSFSSLNLEKMPWVKLSQKNHFSHASQVWNNVMSKTIQESKNALEKAKKNLCDIEIDNFFGDTKNFMTDFFKKKDSQQKWDYQLQTIHSIFPDIPTQDLIPALEHANGDVHIVLNQIMMA